MATSIGYHASQEQFGPSTLLGLVREAEDAGFACAFSSDHLQPWSSTQGHSAFTWSWLAAALQATRHITFGTISVPGGWRYQPVVLAQAIATLAEMFPGRLPWIALGSGEAMNEAPTGLHWPPKDERNKRLQIGAGIIKDLLNGKRVTSTETPAASAARLWCRPQSRVVLAGAATSVESAAWLGSWADALLTTAPDIATLEEIITAFRAGGGDGKDVHVKVDISWAPSEDEALDSAHRQWRYNGLGSSANGEIREPEDFEIATEASTPEQIRERVFVSSDLDAHLRHLRAVAALGVASIDVHNVGTNQSAFIRAFGDHVLPAFRSTAS